MNPLRQLHWNDPALFTHVPPFWHSVEPPVAVHSLTSSAHRAPVQPVAHEQEKLPAVLVHAPPCWHGVVRHSLMSVSHALPLKPTAQEQEYDPSLLMHVAEFKQRVAAPLPAHSLMSVAHRSPPHPVAQLHE